MGNSSSRKAWECLKLFFGGSACIDDKRAASGEPICCYEAKPLRNLRTNATAFEACSFSKLFLLIGTIGTQFGSVELIQHVARLGEDCVYIICLNVGASHFRRLHPR